MTFSPTEAADLVGQEIIRLLRHAPQDLRAGEQQRFFWGFRSVIARKAEWIAVSIVGCVAIVRARRPILRSCAIDPQRLVTVLRNRFKCAVLPTDGVEAAVFRLQDNDMNSWVLLCTPTPDNFPWITNERISPSPALTMDHLQTAQVFDSTIAGEMRRPQPLADLVLPVLPELWVAEALHTYPPSIAARLLSPPQRAVLVTFLTKLLDMRLDRIRIVGTWTTDPVPLPPWVEAHKSNPERWHEAIDKIAPQVIAEAPPESIDPATGQRQPSRSTISLDQSAIIGSATSSLLAAAATPLGPSGTQPVPVTSDAPQPTGTAAVEADEGDDDPLGEAEDARRGIVYDRPEQLEIPPGRTEAASSPPVPPPAPPQRTPSTMRPVIPPPRMPDTPA